MMCFIPGKPVGKQRPRIGNGHAYTPKETKDYENLVAWTYKSEGGQKYEGPICVSILVQKEPPKSASKARRSALLGKYVMYKPDLDNIIKSVLDGLQGVAFDDDACVCRISAAKRYAEETGVWVEVREC